MFGELVNEIAPSIIIFWRRWRWFVPERMKNRAGGQFFRHEAQFDKRTYTVIQKSVVDLIYVGEIVNGLAFRIFVVKADFVMKYCVKPDIAEIGDLLYLSHVASITVTQRENSSTRAEHSFPKMREWSTLSASINNYCFSR